MVIRTVSLLGGVPLEKWHDVDGNFGQSNSMRNEIGDTRDVKRFKIDKHSLELGNDFTHEERVVELVVVLFVNRVENQRCN